MRRLTLLLPLLLAAPAAAETIDRVVVVVEEQIVLASEVRLEAALSRLDHSPSPFWHPDRSTPLDRLVDAAILRERAGTVALYQPGEDEVRARREALREQFADRAAWQAFQEVWGLDEEAVLALLRRRMVVERYLARNVHVRGSDQEAWWQAAEEMLTRFRERHRVREVGTISGQGP